MSDEGGEVVMDTPDAQSQCLTRHTRGQRVFLLIKGTLSDEQMRILKLNMALLRVNQQVSARIGKSNQLEQHATGSLS